MKGSPQPSEVDVSLKSGALPDWLYELCKLLNLSGPHFPYQ